MTGSYITNSWKKDLDVDFFVVKGIVENLLKYMGYENRYSFTRSECSDLHPGVQANIILDGKTIGIIGKVHPSIVKKDIFVFELNLDSLYGKTAKLKYKEAFKYPSITKDMAYILDRNTDVGDVIKTIKKASNKTLQDVSVFDVYEGEQLGEGKKSLAYSLMFRAKDRTLADAEVNEIIDKIVGGKILDAKRTTIDLFGKTTSVICIHCIGQSDSLDLRQFGDYVFLKPFFV